MYYDNFVVNRSDNQPVSQATEIMGEKTTKT